MTTQQITKTDKSVFTDSQVTELQTPIDSVSAIVDIDPWQNLNAAITGIESLIDDNDTRNLDDGETNTDMEINTLVTNSNNETPPLNTESDSIPFVSADFTLVENDVNPLEDPVDSTTNPDNSVEAIDNATDAAIEPTVKPDEISMVDSTSNEIQIDVPLTDAVISDVPSSLEDQVNSADGGITNTDNSSEIIDNPDIVADIGNEIQIDAPLAGAVDVSDGSIMGSLVTLNGLDVANELRGIDNGNLDGLVTNNTDVLTDSAVEYVVWLSYTIRGTDTVVVIGTCLATSESDVELNSIESRDSATIDETQLALFSGDNTTTPNDDVFSNSDIPGLGTLTSNEDSDVLLTDSIDVTNDSIVGDLVMTNEPLGMDSGNLDGSIKDSTDLLTDSTADSLTDTFTAADIGIEKVKVFSPEEVQVAFERNINLNLVEPGDSVFTDKTQATLFSGDTMAAPNDYVFSNSDISILGTLTPTGDSDAPLTDSADVTDDSIVGDLVMTNEPLEIDNGNLDGSIKDNTDLLTDSIVGGLTEDTATIADTDSVDFVGFSPNEIEATSGGDVDLNSMESGDSVTTDETQPILFSGDVMTVPDDDVFSTYNPDITVFGTLTYSAIEDADNSTFIQLIGNSENTNAEDWIV